MFNLIISADEEAWERPTFVLDAERFLEYTNDELKKRFKALDETVRTTLLQLPTLFAYESPIAKPARVGSLKTIEKQGRQIRISYSFDRSVEPVAPERVRAVVWDAFEMTRTHWAVKDGDILDVLAPLGSGSPGAPTYSFSRQTLLTACDLFLTLGHAGFDRFLLEVGIEGLHAGRDRGGLAGRATALAQFVVNNSDAHTADGGVIGVAVVRKAIELDPGRGNTALWRALERDGYGVLDGEIVPLPAAPPARVVPSTLAQSSSPRAKNVLDDLFSDTPPESPPGANLSVRSTLPIASAPPRIANKIFLVHGRDDGAKHEVARFLERLGLEVVILHERPNGGRTLISKFREEAADVGFAVVMMTADDLGSLKPKEGSGSVETMPRARQNVVFELGFFVGKVGPENVCALIAETVERPSDFEGVVYVPFGSGTPWKIDLARELRHAGIPFDPAKVL